ncbi:helix-turn-helix domain-containing protein [Streptomyces sp. NPDC058417]|uniref:helix-turn-helix domain-containing protein n=1 Tax=unclassified Streptomyces TaxID=2593676 RepID=UPI00365B872E
MSDQARGQAEMAADTGNHDPRRRFAEELKSARELFREGPMSQTELGRRTRTSKSTISRLEATLFPIPPELPALLDQIFSTNGRFKKLYEECVAAGFPDLYRRRMALERQAEAIWEWSPTIVPGLLQTPAYARALLLKGAPRATEEETASGVAKRMARQEVLRAPVPPDLRVVLCESVLKRQVGGLAVMREQLAALLDHGSRPTTRVLVLPLDAEAHLLIENAASFLTLPTSVTVVCVEAYRTAGIVEEPEHVKAAVRAYTDLTGEALSAPRSARLITEYMEKL